MYAHTKASILWITLLQTRHFAAGEETLLAEFKTMLEKLVAKDTTITHAEVPAALIMVPPGSPTGQKRKSLANPVSPDEDHDGVFQPGMTALEFLTRMKKLAQHPLLGHESTMRKSCRLIPS